ncbi:31587_t:CDS:2 [Gigaspora margarita]|uniref:31587_t:CDS:1 n=1 Tax=Gigaspora margarita TaxID=4874 RepID=A0ABN7VZZ2_GIGMA|nr:31587_t:CDS:2 [Gigaspora margarita]
MIFTIHTKTKKIEDVDSPEALLIPKDIPSGNNSSVHAKYANHLQGKPTLSRRLSVAKFININCQSLDKVPVEVNRTSINPVKDIKFRRYKLISKQMVNANANYPVVRFTFSIVHRGEKENEQLIGYEIQARGPFDVCERHKSYVVPTNSVSRGASIISHSNIYIP